MRFVKFISAAILSAAVLTPLYGEAKPLTPEEALSRAMGNAPARIQSKNLDSFTLAATREAAGAASLYVFNTRDNDGFMVVGADDAVPALLGYGNASVIAADGQMPDGFAYWIDCLSRQVAFARENASGPRAIAKARPFRQPIEPLAATRWNQDEPYNRFCPSSGMKKTYTGCVATSMAQAMKYHNWPDVGVGSHSYQSNFGTLSIDFEKTPFRWESMLDVYTEGNYTGTEGMSVAALMRACGYSVDMSYSTEGSGAYSVNIPGALATYFKYNKGVEYLQRDYYSLNDWEDRIYRSLTEDGPVIYGGQSYQGGHSFICDGYDKDGYFHFNWGWGGVSDGYFLLDALDPLQQGIGGSTSGFDFMQDIVVGIRPDRDGTSQPVYHMKLNAGLTGPENPVAAGEEFVIEGFLYNASSFEIPSGSIAVRFSNTDGTEPLMLVSDFEALQPFYGFSSFNITLPDELTEGTYKIDEMYKVGDGEWLVAKAPIAQHQYILMEYRNGIATFSEPEPQLPEVTEWTCPDEYILGGEFEASGTVTNAFDTPYYSEWGIIFIDEKGNATASGLQGIIDMDGNESQEFEYKTMRVNAWQNQIFSPGVYTAAMYVSNGRYAYTISEGRTVTVKRESGVAAIEGADPAEIESSSYYTLQGIRIASPETLPEGTVYLRVDRLRDGKTLPSKAVR